MITTLSLLAVGFFLGMRHATDADHIMAVTTILSRKRSVRGAAWIGVLWGLGHTLTVTLVGGAIIVFTFVIPPRIGVTMEIAVGVMLVILGLMNLAGLRRWIRDNVASEGPIHAHMHVHGDYAHTHEHGHGVADHGHAETQTPQAWLDRKLGGLSLYQALRPIVVGVVHGLAGSTAVALLVLAAIPDPVWGMLYLALFGIGTIAGMMLVTVAIAAPIAYSSRRFPRFSLYLRGLTGLISVGFGVFLIYYVGFVP